MLKNNINMEIKKYFEQKVKNKIENLIERNLKNFKISLELCGAVDDEKNYNFEKISYYGEYFANKMIEKIINEDIDSNSFMKSAIDYYNIHDEIGLITLIAVYNNFIKQLIPYDIIQFAIDSDILHCFSKAFIKVYKNKLALIS